MGAEHDLFLTVSQKSNGQVAEMKYLKRVKGVTTRDRLKNTDIL